MFSEGVRGLLRIRAPLSLSCKALERTPSDPPSIKRTSFVSFVAEDTWLQSQMVLQGRLEGF